MDYDLTKVGPVCSEEPVMVMVRDKEDGEWSGPYTLLAVTNQLETTHPYDVWEKEYRDIYKYAELYKEPEKTTRPMNIEEVVQLVKDGAGFTFSGNRANVVFFPMVEYDEGDCSISLSDTIYHQLIEDVRYIIGNEEPRKLEVEVTSE